MCLLLFYVNPHPEPDGFYLILINVRDEIYNRPTKCASFWDKHPEVIGGMDLEPGREGGTWLAMNKNGKIGALLNILQPDDEILPNKKGRGFLAVDYAVGGKDCKSYLEDICLEKNEYNGFLLVTLDLGSPKNTELSYFTNATALSPVKLQPGIHAFGNSVAPDKPWPKVIQAKEKFTQVINSYASTSNKDTLVEELFKLLQDRTCYKLDDNMKTQGKGKPKKFMDKLSAIFVHIPESSYGSRCHTVILIDSSGSVDYFERSRDEAASATSNEKWLDNHFIFKLEL